jgi:hypothetical protein
LLITPPLKQQYKDTDNNWDCQTYFHIFINMTIDEFKNQYEFKLVKKALMREFPFVKDVTVRNEEDINRWKYTSYVELVIDPFILGNMFNMKVWYVVVNSLKRGEPYWSTTLSIYFVGNDRFEVVGEVRRRMETLMDEIHNSPAIPQELKMDKNILIGTYIANPDSLPPFHDDITSGVHDL